MEPLPKPKSKSAAKKTPPNPPIEKCTNCRDFTFKGSIAYTVKKTCRDCGHVTVTRREESYQFAFENCPTRMLITVEVPRYFFARFANSVETSSMRCQLPNISIEFRWPKELRTQTPKHCKWLPI